MKTVSSVKQAFQDRIPEMPPSVSKVAEWLAQNTAEVAWSRVQDIARQIGVSPATVIRAIKQSGWQGYSELQRAVRERIPRAALASDMFEEAPSEAVPGTIVGVIDDIKQMLGQLEASVAGALDPLLDQLLSASRILVVGSLMTVPLAEYLALQLRLLLGRVDHIDASSSRAWLDYRDLESTDCVVGLSFPRYAKATQLFLRHALARTPNVLLITDRGGPALPKGRLTVRLPSRLDYHYSAHISLLALMHILARSLADRDPSRVLGNVHSYDEIWSQLDVLRKF